MGMPLLTPDTVKKTAAKGEQEARVRVRDLAMEEERLITSINDLHKDESDAKEHYAGKVAKFRADADAEMRQIELEVAPKRAERERLMKPIDDLEAQANERNQRSQEREQAIVSRETDLETDKKAFGEYEASKLAEFADKKQVQDEREGDLDKREERVRGEEERSRESLEGLNQRWAQFHETVAEKEKELVSRETDVASRETAVAIRKEQQDKKDFEQSEKDREIQSRYAQLEKASEEIYKLRNQTP